jgi:hypothetical protein
VDAAKRRNSMSWSQSPFSSGQCSAAHPDGQAGVFHVVFQFWRGQHSGPQQLSVSVATDQADTAGPISIFRSANYGSCTLKRRAHSGGFQDWASSSARNDSASVRRASGDIAVNSASGRGDRCRSCSHKRIWPIHSPRPRPATHPSSRPSSQPCAKLFRTRSSARFKAICLSAWVGRG